MAGQGKDVLHVWEKWKEEEHVWPASRIFADYLISHPTSLPNNAKVVEVGAGTGVLSMGIAMGVGGVGSVTATDGSRDALKNLRKNVVQNGLSSKIDVKHLEWRDDLPSWMGGVDVIVGSDVVYGDTTHSTSYFFLSRMVAEVLGRGQGKQEEGMGMSAAKAMFMLQVRGKDYEASSVNKFVEDLERRGLHVEFLEIPEGVDNMQEKM
ncbi:hypothetical protein GUITHDRAFT_134645 [Guillardia theta CCMP2712]|uniref:Methyltransferase small domain-containing protein n=1 Tax=Guillardia theta (strain CCMP2712) TaxID=905079 RepID=L1JSG3_GUITC|nr:hypothetical protein GUITHDRAFT_134645 [Guillardia theta CCMP2712]EKX51130.1 hypothetical protein GUITHDRAFT_134645 [Guillardia theta CCMP2712]|eukprot:XP_005838110.1 hypothetical protein GUITHDRAFT_134645 [Guillardia theta CCMP2712]